MQVGRKNQNDIFLGFKLITTIQKKKCHSRHLSQTIWSVCSRSVGKLIECSRKRIENNIENNIII